MKFALRPLVFFLLLPRGIVIQSVKAIGAVFAEIFLVFRCIFGVFGKIPFQLLAAMFIAPFFQRTF